MPIKQYGNFFAGDAYIVLQVRIVVHECVAFRVCLKTVVLRFCGKQFRSVRFDGYSLKMFLIFF